MMSVMVGRLGAAALLIAALCACSAEETESEPTPPPDEQRACIAGETTRDDGSCQAAGIPDGSCAPGFASDGSGACVAVLPMAPCPDGMIALPGDEACREIAPCGTGTWGEVVVDGNTQFVDVSFSGTSNGSEQAPWTSIQDGINAAVAGGTVAVAAGQYDEFLVVSGKPVVLSGRCPSMVSVVAPAGEMALRLLANSHGSVIRGIALSGGKGGIETSVARDVLIEQLWIHDVPGEGVVLRDVAGEPLVTLRTVLIERALNYGLYLTGATLIAEDVEIRRGADAPSNGLGMGVWAQDGVASARRANLTVRNAVIDRNRDLGFFLGGVDAQLEGVLVRDTQPVNGMSGRGIEIRDNPASGNRSNVTLRGVLVERSHHEGVFTVGSDLTMETSVIRDTFPRSDGRFGRGLSQEPDPMSAEAGVVLVRESVVERSHDQGIYTSHGQMTVEASIVRDTLPQAVDMLFGRGITVRHSPEGPAQLTIRGSVVERNFGIGIVLTTDALVETTVVRGTVPRQTDQALGDGIVVVPFVGAVPTVVVSGSLLEGNTRAGVANFDAHVALSGNTFECNGIHLNAEQFMTPFTMEDLGDNVCGCGGDTLVCQVLSASLLPPEAIDGAPP
jgi:hypothetical protein